MTETRPTSEQLRFVSTQTGEHILDVYLEAAERGGRPVPDLLADLFGTSGQFNSDLVQFRVNASTSFLQVRVGTFTNSTAGWLDIPDGRIFRQRGVYATATAYSRLDVVTQNNSTFVCTSAHTSSTAAPDPARFQVILDGTALNTATASAQTSATNAATSATSASNSATAAQVARTAAELALDSFDDRYLGAKATAPTLDNDGNALQTGALYWNTTLNLFYAWSGSAWTAVPQGAKGDPGNYLGIDLIGSGTSLAQRPASANEGDAWGLLGDQTIRIYVWTSGAWFDAGPLTAPSAFPVAGTIYVQGNGNDANSGASLATSVATIERALQIVTASNRPMLIEVYPGEYVTQGHLDMPDDCVLRAPHRTVVIRPAAGFETRNVFRMGSGCFIEGVLVEGFRLDSLTNPTTGFAFSFRPGAVISRVPYAHKCAIRTPRTWSAVAPPLDRDNGNPAVGIGGGVVLADGLVCSPYSPFPNIMTWGATPVSHNGIGYCASNGGLINAVNAVSMWAHKHFLAMSGGQIILSACSTQFGDFSLVAQGYREIVVPAAVAGTSTVQTAAATAIQTAQTTIIDNMWAALVANGYTAGWTAQDEAFTRADAALFLQCIRWGLEYANETPIQNFAAGLFNTVGELTFDPLKLPAFVFSFENMRDQINALGIASAAQTMVTNMTAAVVTTISAPVKRREPSKITAIGHTWTAVMAGVALARIPPANNAAAIRDSIIEQDDGVIVASGQDDQGNGIFVGGLEISADTGELGGSPFDAAVRRVATRAAIARSF
jgi:hypothetical protein